MRHHVRVLLSLAALLGAAPFSRAAAQGTIDDPPPRPRLARGADPNDWGAYFDAGVERLKLQRPQEAGRAFWWASQIDPERAEPLFARWVAFWMSDYGRWTRLLAGDERVRERPEVIAADSLPRAALERNPFVHQGLAILLYDQLPGRWRQDELTRGWINYAKPDFPRAVEALGRALHYDSKARSWIRTMRAQSFVAMAQYDSAAAELHALDAELTARDERMLGAEYQSKEMLHYALGALYGATGRADDARTELAAALTENLAFAPAHDMLCHLALARGDTAAAIAECEQAVQLAPDDAVFQYRYAVALLGAGRTPDALPVLRRATALRPWYASPYFALGATLDALGDRDAAREAYARFAERAPRADSLRLAKARAYR